MAGKVVTGCRAVAPRRFPLADMDGGEPGFPAAVAACGMALPWTETVAVGRPLGRAELGALASVAEAALGLIALHARDAGPLGDACRQALDNAGLARELALDPEPADKYDRTERECGELAADVPGQFGMAF